MVKKLANSSINDLGNIIGLGDLITLLWDFGILEFMLLPIYYVLVYFIIQWAIMTYFFKN